MVVWFAGVLELHFGLVEAFHAARGEGVFFEDGREVVDGERVEAHREAEEACLCDEGVEGCDEGGGVGRLVVEGEERGEVGVEDADGVVDVVGEIGGESEGAGGLVVEDGAEVGCIMFVAVKTCDLLV